MLIKWIKRKLAERKYKNIKPDHLYITSEKFELETLGVQIEGPSSIEPEIDAMYIHEIAYKFMIEITKNWKRYLDIKTIYDPERNSYGVSARMRIGVKNNEIN